MSIIQYLITKIDNSLKDIHLLEADDEVPFMNFIEQLLNNNFILDGMKNTGTYMYAVDNDYFVGNFAKIFVNEVTSMIKSVSFVNYDDTIAGLLDPSEKHMLRLSVERMLNAIKNKSKGGTIDENLLSVYIENTQKMREKLFKVWNKNEYKDDTSKNNDIKMLYILNVIDEYITKILASERNKMSISMNGLFTKNIRGFIGYFIKIIEQDNRNANDLERLITEFIVFADERNKKNIGGSIKQKAKEEVEEEEGPKDFKLTTIIADLDKDGSFDVNPDQYLYMAYNNEVPCYVEKDYSGDKSKLSYDPTYIFYDQRLHNSLAIILLNDSELNAIKGDFDKFLEKIVNFVFEKYPQIKSIRSKHEKRSFVNPSAPKGISCVYRSLNDLVRLYNLYNKYDILPLDPVIQGNVFVDKHDSFIIGQWILSLKEQAKLFKEGSITAYPFIREYISRGGKQPDVELSKYLDPVAAWKLTLYGSDMYGGFFSEGGDDFILHVDNKKTLNYIVAVIFGFILARNYTDYNLFYKLKKTKPVVKTFGGGDSNKAGVLSGDNYEIDRRFPFLYRDISILGRWYFRKINEPEVTEIISQIGGRWSTLLKIFLDIQEKGGAYLIQDINIIVFTINQHIPEFDNHEISDDDIYKNIIDDFIQTVYLVLKAYVGVRTGGTSLPLELGVDDMINNYKREINSMKPIIQIDAAIMERYNYDDSIINRIYKIKTRYDMDIKNSQNSKADISTGDVRVLMESLNYESSIMKKGGKELKLCEMIYKLAENGLLHTNYVKILSEIYRNIVPNKALPRVPDFVHVRNKRTEEASMMRMVKHINDLTNVNTDISTSEDELAKFFERYLCRRFVLDTKYTTPIKSIRYDVIEKSLDDDSTVLSEYVNKHYEGVVDTSTGPFNNMIHIFNHALKNFSLDGAEKYIKEYVNIKYDPKRMSKISKNNYIVFESLLSNLLYVIMGLKIKPDPKIKQIEFMVDESISPGVLGDKILYNEIALLNTKIDVVRTMNYFKPSSLYISNVYYNYFMNYMRTVGSDDMDIENMFNIFKVAYYKSMDLNIQN